MYERLRAVVVDGCEKRRWEAAYEADDDTAFTGLLGPVKIPGEIGQFLGWYVIAKLMPNQELARACGTVPDQRGVAHCRGRKCLPVGTGPSSRTDVSQ